jgi:carboxymethylenebutenolidase
MCDDFTAIEEQQALDRRGVDRRGFAGMSAAGIAALAVPVSAKTALALAEAMVKVPAGAGQIDAFFVHPARGRHPAVIVWPDVAGLRDAYKVMARRLAGEGYAVLVLNQYYRSLPAPIFNAMAEWRTPEGQAKLKPIIPTLTPAATEADAKAAVAWLDKQKAVNKGKGIGTSGYCMGGPFTVRTAHAVPGRVRAAASFHGGSLVTDKPDSPHKLLAATKASYLFAVARNDDARAPGDKDALRAAATAARRPAEIEVYPADHGWCTIDSPVFDKVQADRAWERMLALFKTL